MTILDEITAAKREEVLAHRARIGERDLQQLPSYHEPRRGLSFENPRAPKLIAEFKRKSPSKGTLPHKHRIEDVVRAYEKAGAAAVSILSDSPFFGGSLEDLVRARHACGLPVLRKDFIIDPYQLYEARAYGADIVLLIMRILDGNQCADLAELAEQLQLQVLLEVHDAEDVERCVQANVRPSFYGINSRSLSSLAIDHAQSSELLPRLPSGVPVIAESGISGNAQLRQLAALGFSGFLVGTHLLEQANPELACRELLTGNAT